MGETNLYALYPVGNRLVRILIPSRRKDKRLLDQRLIIEQKTKVQAFFQKFFGGTAPEESPRIGTWQHEDGSVTREAIRIVESTAPIEKLKDKSLRKRIEQLAADVCRDMDQDCVFVSWGTESFLIDDQRPNRNAPVSRFAALPNDAQDKIVQLCWMGIRSLDFILQILSLNGWQEPKSPIKVNGAYLLANHREDEGNKRAWREPNAKHKWARRSLYEGDILFSPAENGLTIRLFHEGKIRGPKMLYFSDTGANPRTHLLLKCLLREDLSDLSELLDRKDIRDGFFKGYKSLLNELQDLLKKSGLFRDREFSQAQLLLGRLMFVKFIEQRGWLAGNKHYVRGLFEGRKDVYKTVLIPLFFDILNNNERNLQPPELPFLNGGLFYPRENENQVDIPDDFFKRVFKLFDDYNYTVEETPGSDDAVIVDPSMFGKVLESLNEPKTRKQSGIHYTPKPIAHALAFEAILARLTSLTGFPNDQVRQFCYGEMGALRPIQADKINDFLPELRIVDPAVGSGALLLSCLEVMMKIAECCHERMGNPLKKGEYAWGKLCRQFVCNCLFGVDIAEDAVEIAKLRLWLAVAIGDVKPKPLPDLEFNIRRADSLLEDDSITKNGSVQLRLDLFEQDILWNKYFNTISKYQKAGIADPFEQHVLLREVEDCQMELLAWLRTHGKSPEGSKKKKRSRQYDNFRFVPFSWRLHFGPVFHDNGGFDIVIANPPYVRVQNIDKRLKEKYSAKWDILQKGSADLYYAFIQLALDLAVPGGEISFIMPNFSRNASGKYLRKLLSENTNIRRWVDFDDTQIFLSATNYVALLFASKQKHDTDTFPCSSVRDKSWIAQSSTRWIEERADNYLVEVPYETDPWLTIPKNEADHIVGMCKNHNTLGELVDISVGIQTSADLLYLFEDWLPDKNGLVKVFSRGVKRWFKIEKSLLRKCIKGARRKSASDKDIYLLWPYGKNAELLTPGGLEKKFHNGWNYLKRIEKKLRKREGGKIFDDDKWYRFGRNQGIEQCMQPKVIVPAILKSGAAVIDLRGKLAHTASGEGGGGAWGLRPKTGSSVNLEKLAYYLRSEDVWRYFKAMGFPKRSGWRGVDKSVLTGLPVPESYSRVKS